MQDVYHLWEDGSYCQLLPCPIVKHLIFIPAVPEWLQEAVQLGTSVRKLILALWLPRSHGLPCMPHSAAKPEAPSHTFKQDITQRKISILHWLGHLPWASNVPRQNYLGGMPAGLALSCLPNQLSWLPPMTWSWNWKPSSSVARGVLELPSNAGQFCESSTILPLLRHWCWFLGSCTKLFRAACASLLLWLLLVQLPFWNAEKARVLLLCWTITTTILALSLM